MTAKTPKIEFMPGSFDNWEGTQEELDSFVEEITEMLMSGELLENSIRIDLDDLYISDPDLYEELTKDIETIGKNRKLN
jgi:hypothetical protein